MLLADLIEVSARVAATRSRKEKTALVAELLARAEPDEVQVVATYLSGVPRQRLPLLHLKPEAHSRWFDWPGLFRALELSRPPEAAGLRFDNYTLLVQAAIAGQGVAIGWRHLVDELLEQGLLCRPIRESAASRYGYYAVLPERKRRARLLQPFVDWLRAELEQDP